MTDKQHAIIWSLALLAAFLALWQWLPAALGIPDFVLPNASKTWSEAQCIWGAERLLWHAGITALEVMVGELVSGNMGLGYPLVFFEGQGNTAGMFVIIAALTVIGIAAYYAVVWAEKRVLHCLPSSDARSA